MGQTTGKTRQEIIEQDMRDLHRLGYAQQLFREMGGFSNFAISFSIISILTGAILLFGFGLRFAGPIVNSVGWPLVSLFVLMIAASMAELASAYPTAGGLYFWAYRLGGARWAWTTAWFNMIGTLGWYFNSRILKRRGVPGFQARLNDLMVPLMRFEERWQPRWGMSLLAIGQRD